MTPTWQTDDGSVRLFLADCLDVLPTLEGVDAVVTDPPYLNLTGGYSYQDLGGVASKINESISIGDKWDADLSWVPGAIRVTRFGAIVFCSYHGLPETATAFSSLRRAVLWTWHKRNAPTTGANVPRFTEEYAWGFAKRPGLNWDAIKSTLIDVPKLATGCCANRERLMDANGLALHPAQKPLEVMLRVLEVVPRGHLVADCFMGTGTTGIACVRTGRRFIGVERDPEHFANAVKRFENETGRAPLFEKPPAVQRNLLEESA